jgi:hypothetical protein
VVIEGLRLLAETQQALGEGPAAVATGEHRREELTRLLAQDPGDGFLRGQLAYDRALEGSFSKAWTLLSEGLEKTDAEDFEELALLHFSTAVPVLESLDPTRRDHQQAGRLAHATLLRGLLARAQSRGACLEHRTALLNGLAMAEVMSGDTAAATRTLDAWEVLDPANATIIEMRHQIRTATEPGR